ncbi:heavy metal translocating P-type ATPase [Moraxella sp. FZLJ2107]|uniref:heavy metal translocating P-type ATPase n=1 Tax=unclassified Moraxella TaxID=2685852 RepID=UPI0020C8DAEE|nr:MULTISPECIES: heavy metal translocating P-type ATPase [unclassified Moraxella]UTO05905.1 heavy metal translocating P-type ATPase [Moraxella sp. FZLJ2107]UTO22641.1 heavy metal translocating P-type ATPase [Moraxella sp. FZLJ2109]
MTDRSAQSFDTADTIEQSLVLPPEGSCFHCGEVLPKEPFFTLVFDKPRAMCCLGCQLASQSIVEAGLSQYYLDRREISPTASLPDAINFTAYDHDDIKGQFVYAESGGSTAELSVANLKCSACTWLIETRLRAMDGVKDCQVNLTQQRMRVNWDDSVLPISEILKAVHSVGYDAKPYRQDTHEAMLKRQNKKMLIRLGIAALGAMQAMMFSIGMYFGEYSGMLIEHRDFLRYVSLFVSIPVFFYAAVPFFVSAFYAIRARQINMDVPVSIALILTFAASLYATLIGGGETYFDSVAMFIFFLLAGRYIEQNARLKASNMAADLVVIEPTLVQKLPDDPSLITAFHAGKLDQAFIKNWQNAHDDEVKLINLSSQSKNISDDKILAQSVKVGDIIAIDAGSQIVADGILLSNTATVSQSLLTGESDLIVKNIGDQMVGGSQNDSQPFVMLVTADVDNSQIALIDRLMNRAMSEKPKIAQDADRMARWFVARVLVLALLVFAVWWFIDKNEALWATVAVLVATCPCALSLATPIALTVATNRLASFGFLSTRGHTVQTLSSVSHVAFDKTGTLTTGQANLLSVITDLSKQVVLARAAALEIGSRHPVAKALLTAAHGLHLPAVSDVVHHTAGGIEAVIDGVWHRVGHISFVTDGQMTDGTADALGQFAENLGEYQANMSVLLSQYIDGNWQVIARFYFNDALRADAKAMIKNLQNLGITPLMLTGDPNANALKVAADLGIDDAYYGLTPEDKVNHIKRLQEQGKTVLMVGDGINDAPVLAAANVSTSIAGAADLAQVSSDSVLLGGRLQSIVRAIEISSKSQRIIRQNLRWALIYNTAVLLPAAFGYVPPWLAAIGMSLSSLAVVLNALRIKRA